MFQKQIIPFFSNQKTEPAENRKILSRTDSVLLFVDYERESEVTDTTAHGLTASYAQFHLLRGRLLVILRYGTMLE